MLLKKKYRMVTEKKWNIGFVQNSLDGIFNGEELSIKWMKHDYKDRWFADPFILDETESEIIVLVEEFSYLINRGRLSMLTVDKISFELRSVIPILELETHLSFPAIIRRNNKIYVYPENYQGGGQKVYELDLKINKLIFLKSISKAQLTDAIFTELLGKKQIFSTDYTNPNGLELDVYEPDEKGSYVKVDQIDFPENIARNAGDWFLYKNEVYRPAQESNVNYGHGISLQKITTNEGKILFEEVRRMISPNKSMNIAFHTMNIYKNLIVVDCQGFRHGFVAKIISNLRNLF